MIKQISLIAVLLFLLCSAAYSQGAYTDGKAAGLSEAQIAQLKELNAAIGLPTYIPRGFFLDSLNIEEPPAPEIVGYNLVYVNDQGRSFMIQSVNDGVGDVSEPKVFGKNQYFNNRIGAGYSFDDHQTLFVSWIESKKAYQPKGSTTQLFSLVADKGDITLQEGVRIMASLRYLKR